MPYIPKAWVKEPITTPDLRRIETQYDEATEESLVVESALPVALEEPDQVQTGMGPAVEFADTVTRSVIFNRRWPWGNKGMSLEFAVAADVANAGSFRVRVAYQINGAAAVNVDFTLTPGSNTALYQVDPGQIIAPGGIAAGALLTVKLSRLGADAADTHTGKMRLYHLRMKKR